MLLTQTRVVCSALISFSFAAFALAAVPQTINYQGYLKNTASGSPISGSVNMTFSLYSSNPTRSNPVWRESKIVNPVNGIYGTQLGSATPITATFDVPYYLGVLVGTDPTEMLQPLSSTGYAFRAGVAESALSIANPQQYLLVQHAGTGTGSVTSSPPGINTPLSPLALFQQGQTLTLTATSDSTSTFSGWSGACSGIVPCIITMDSLKAVTATFSRPKYTLSTVSIGGGTLVSDPAGIYCGVACSSKYDSGTIITLSPTPNPGLAFRGWSGSCTGSGSTCTVTIDGNKAVISLFAALLTTTLNVTGTGSGTITSSPAGISCGATCTTYFDANAAVTLTATPDQYSSFIAWTGCDSTFGTTCNLSMTQGKSVSATFNRSYYAITVNTGGSNGGSGSVSLSSSPSTGLQSCSVPSTCSYNYVRSSTISIAAIPDSGSTFASWTNCPSPTGNVCTLFNIQVGQSITANFSKP